MDCDESPKTAPMDVREVNRFMNREAPQIHESYGGLLVHEDGHLIIPDHYKLELLSVITPPDIACLQYYPENCSPRFSRT
jgi:hypothetical protein